MHNSNHKLRQTTLLCETLPENPFFVIGFVPLHVVRLRHSWFGLLNAKELRCISKFLLKPCQKSDCAKCISDAKDESKSRLLFDQYDSHRKREPMTLMDEIQEKIHARLLALFPYYNEQIT